MAFRDSPNGPSFWRTCKRRNIAAITYEPVAQVNLSHYQPLKKAPGWAQLKAPEKGCLKHFVDHIQPGDIVYAREGEEIVGRGVVVGSYRFEAAKPVRVKGGRTAYHHQRPVLWCREFQPRRIRVGRPAITTLLPLAPGDVERIEA
jgi:hypothetical protein